MGVSCIKTLAEENFEPIPSVPPAAISPRSPASLERNIRSVLILFSIHDPTFKMSFSTFQISYSASLQDYFTLSSIFKSLLLPLTLSHLPITLGSHGLCFCFLKAASLDAALEPLHWLVLLFGAPLTCHLLRQTFPRPSSRGYPLDHSCIIQFKPLLCMDHYLLLIYLLFLLFIYLLKNMSSMRPGTLSALLSLCSFVID